MVMALHPTPTSPLEKSEEKMIMHALDRYALSQDIRSASVLLRRLPAADLCGLIAAHVAARDDIGPQRLEALSNELGRRAWEMARRGQHG